MLLARSSTTPSAAGNSKMKMPLLENQPGGVGGGGGGVIFPLEKALQALQNASYTASWAVLTMLLMTSLTIPSAAEISMPPRENQGRLPTALESAGQAAAGVK